MAGNTRSADSAKQPFNSFCGHMHSNLDNFVGLHNDGTIHRRCEQYSVDFGSKYAQEFDSWNTFGAKFYQGSNKMLCFENEKEEPVKNGDHGLKFVNGFAAQMRHNTVATYSSDESEIDCNLSTYEIDSNVSSSPSHCSTKSCVKSTSSQEYCTDFTETDSRMSNTSIKSNVSISRSPSSLRMSSSNETARDAMLVDINMAVAGSNRDCNPGVAVHEEVSVPSDLQQKQIHDENSNVIDNGTLLSKANCCVKTMENKTGIAKTTGETFLARIHKTRFTYNQHNSNLGLVQDWLDNSIDSVNNNLLLEQHKLDGQRARPGLVCKCCAEQDNKSKVRGKRFRKGKKNRKFEYEVVKRESLRKKKVLNGHSKRKKDKRLKSVYGLDKRRLNLKKGKIESEKGSIRRKLAMQRINETDAKKMIKELKRTLKRVSAEIEELKKLTSKKKKPKQILKTDKKGGRSQSDGRQSSSSSRKHLVKTHCVMEPYRYVPKEKFTFQCAIPSTPSLTVRNGDLEPAFSMVFTKGALPPKKHPVWSWKLGKPPLPGTVIKKQTVIPSKVHVL
ncbi:uncharacterized protein [Apostichopus japonicus]|uniref:uncharacterized protein n=1 Tax=Stichopus japonicus TaxID=307972 RepID=UPI003AB593BE